MAKRVGEFVQRWPEPRVIRGQIDSQKRAGLNDHARSRAIGLDSDNAGGGPSWEPLPQQGHVLEAVEQRNDETGVGGDPGERVVEPGGLGGDEQHVDGSFQPRRHPRPGHELPEADALDADPVPGDDIGSWKPGR